MTGPEEFIHDFFAQTGYSAADMPPKPESERAPLYKSYPGAPTIALQPPAPPDPGEAEKVKDAIAERRSVRAFTDRPLTLAEVSKLVWATQGITLRRGERELRAAPSAGAQYPVETYLAVNRCEGVEAGVYHLNVPDPALERIHEGPVGAALADACLGQRFIATCSVVFVWTGIYKRMLWRYGKRGLRYIFMDAGHIGENLHLAATAMGLGCCAVGAFYDDEVASVLGVDGKDELPIYLSAVGESGEARRDIPRPS